MKSDLLISKKILYPIAIFGLVFTAFSVTLNLESLGIPFDMGLILIYSGLFANFLASVILIVDVFKNNLSSKYIWTLSFLFLGALSGLFYLRNRDQYLANVN
ncbi:hypothetical protein [Kaistella yonginensis]|uniref:hypothetical protein n=1 Tax=Kaistella yonginensis TaxID=658267 RepID=UPI0025B3D5BA|nr:hypothetical protein [Kaistella yonginensis]MDN3605403.1 hypothetical protein [Kaistella yonginensis]